MSSRMSVEESLSPRGLGCWESEEKDDIWQDVTLLRAATHCDHMPPASLHSMKAASTKLCWQDSARFQQPQQPRRRRKLRRRSATKHSRSATASSGPAKTRSVAEASDGPPHIAMEAWKQKPIEQQKLNSSEQVTAPSARESTRQSVLPRRQMLLRRGHPWPIQEPHQKALGAAVAERAARLDKRRQEIAFAFQEALGSSRNMQLFCGVLDAADDPLHGESACRPPRAVGPAAIAAQSAAQAALAMQKQTVPIVA